jgi:hypothetical protein
MNPIGNTVPIFFNLLNSNNFYQKFTIYIPRTVIANPFSMIDGSGMKGLAILCKLKLKVEENNDLSK